MLSTVDIAAIDMTRATFHILLALADGEKHGYAIMQEVEQLTGGEVRLGPGTLYAALQRLTEEGWIEECPPPREERALAERRRYYRLTREGRSGAAKEAERLRELVGVALRRRLLGHA